jgi:hypothetical protein
VAGRQEVTNDIDKTQNVFVLMLPAVHMDLSAVILLFESLKIKRTW